jgi:hypothetical protein
MEGVNQRRQQESLKQGKRDSISKIFSSQEKEDAFERYQKPIFDRT